GFGWHRLTLGRLAAERAKLELAHLGLAPAGTLALEALSARVIQRLATAGTLGRLAAVADQPGTARALARTLGALRMAGITDAGDALARVQKHLFAEAPVAELDASVALMSAPGESRECVEIARRVLHEAEAGVPFDRIAVLLRAPELYRVHVEEAMSRAGIPVHFDAGTRLPDPSGRAFLALLACAADGLSAHRFGEYLSLREVPGDLPPPAAPRGDPWV